MSHTPKRHVRTYVHMNARMLCRGVAVVRTEEPTCKSSLEHKDQVNRCRYQTADMSLSRLITYIISFGVLISETNGTIGGVSVSFCKDTKDGDWRNKLTETLLEVSFSSSPVDCGAIGAQKMAVAVFGLSNEKEVIKRTRDETLQLFIATILRKISSSRIITVEEKLLNVLYDMHEAIVGYVLKKDSLDHIQFQQASLSHAVPNVFQIFLTHDKNLLPDDVISHVKRNIHVWIITDNQWGEIYLPVRPPDSSEVMHILIQHFSKLSLPQTITYSGEVYEGYYDEFGLRYILIFHYSSQYNDVKSLIDPLMNKFRTYILFITIDCDVFPEMIMKNSISHKKALPYIITKKPRQRNGLHIDSEFIPYTIKRLSDLLKSLVDPSVNNDELSPRPPEGISISRVPLETFQSITEYDDTPTLVTFCNKGSVECDIANERMMKAMKSSVSETPSVMRLFVVDCKNHHDITFLNVPILPFIAVKSEGVWIGIDEDISVITYIKSIQQYSISIPESRQAYSDEYHSFSESRPKITRRQNDFFNQYNELHEDDIFGTLFTDYLYVPDTLPILTSDNYTSFINQFDTCLIGFYLPYCIHCKVMIYHLINTVNQMKSAGMPTAVVNCADYPDVCEAFEVFIYPTVKYKVVGGDWEVYKGVLSVEELLLLSKYETVDNEKTSNIIELSPSYLLQLLQSDGLSTLLIICAEDITTDMKYVLSEVKGHDVYWLNSTMYQKASEFLIGLEYAEPPVLVWIDYIQLSLYRLRISDSTTQNDIINFITDISNEKISPDSNLDTPKWTPRSPPLQFPSKYYMSRHGPENNDWRHDYNEGAVPPSTHEILDKDTPTYSSTNYHSGGSSSHEEL